MVSHGGRCSVVHKNVSQNYQMTQSSHSQVYSEEIESRCFNRNVYINVHIGAIHNIYKLEHTPMSIK
jgi:hypothetical protein